MRLSCEMDWQDDSLLGNANPTTPDHHNATHPGTSQARSIIKQLPVLWGLTVCRVLQVRDIKEIAG